jgi:chromosome segregation ATPase
MEAAIADMVAAQQQKWQDAASTLDTAAGDKKRELTDALAGFDGIIEKQKESLDKTLAEYWQKWLQSASDMDGRVSSQERKWEAAAAELDTAITGAEREALENLEAKKREVSEALAAFDRIAGEQREAMDAGMATQRDNMEAAIGDMVAAQQQKWQDAADTLDAIAGDKKRELTNALAGFDGIIENQKESLDKALAEHWQKWLQSVSDIDGQVSSQERKWEAVAAELKEALTGTESQARQIIEAKKQELADALNTFNSIAEKQKESLDTGFTDQEQGWKDAIATLDRALDTQRQSWRDAAAELEELFAAQREKTEVAMIEAERQVLEDTEGRFEEYRAAQTEELKQLDALAGDVVQLEEELRKIMAEAESRVRSDFMRFRDESAESQANAAASFDDQVKNFRNAFNTIGRELEALKNRAYDNVSGKLKVFEDDFFADLSTRGEDIEHRLVDWQKTMENRLAEIGEDSEEKRRSLEFSYTEKIRKNLAEQGERLIAELEHLRDDTTAFEEGIREQMRSADETRVSFREQFDRDLEDLRSSAEASVKVEIGHYALTTAETLRKRQRELEEQLKQISSFQENRNGEFVEFMDITRKNIEDWQAECTARQRDIETALDGSRNRMKELETENTERIFQIRTALEKIRGESGAIRQEIFAHTQAEASNLDTAIAEAEQHIRDFTDQTRLFDRTDELKQELTRSIEDLKGDIDRLEQRKSEVAQIETEFSRIKHLADDVNAKMARFAADQGRIEVMEKDVDRLLQTSRSVENKLTQVLNTDDALENLQIQIRRLEEALKETEEKYQRIERRKQTLDETSNGIARNFQALQDSEITIRQNREELNQLLTEMQSIRNDITALSGDGERARVAAEKLSSLDGSLLVIEKRIAQMETAREWIARTETRLTELNKEIQDKFKLIETIVENKSPPPMSGKGAPSSNMRDNVIKLTRMGWSVQQIAKNLKLSEGEVELIRELASRD